MISIVIDRGSISIEGEATVHCVAELHAGLTAALAQVGETFEVHLDKLEALDLIGAQVLLALRNKVGAGHVTFTGWPPHIGQLLAVAGLTSSLPARGT
jgi:anti-anti-sigma regulatory factor